MMTNHRPLTLVAAAAVVAVLAGCASKVPLNNTPPPVETAQPTTPTATAPAAETAVAPVDLTAQQLEAANRAGRTIYFDFDRYDVRDDARPVLDAWSKVLTTQRDRKMMLEGHTDDVGGREYNLALGQRRADATARAMGVLGVQPGQIEAVSYGKERPAVMGTSDEARAKNRRVELKDR